MNEPRYAWVVVWRAFSSMAVIFGVAYSFAAFFESFAAEFAAPRADVALVFGLSGLIYFVLGVVGGILADRFGARAVFSIIGMLYSGAALGNLLGPVVAGAVFDRTGSYDAVIWACIALSALATLASARLIGPRQKCC